MTTPTTQREADERAQKALAAIRDRLALTYRICCGTSPKQSVGELLDVTINMPEWEIVRAAIDQSTRQTAPEAPTALSRYKEHMQEGDELDPLERLRFFCSLAMSGQDWLDVEPFFDALSTGAAPEAPALATTMQALRDLLQDVQAGVLDGDAVRDAQALLDKHEAPDSERDQKITALIAEIRAAKTMARRDDLFDQIIGVWEGTAATVDAQADTQQAEKVSCPECSGTGSVMMEGDCGDCNGKGYGWEPVESATPAATTASASDACAEMRALCSACGGTGDVHSIDGEWRGICDCEASAWSRAPAQQTERMQPSREAAPLTDEQIIAVLHSLGIDTYPSKYGFDAVQVSATSVPSIRQVVEKCAAMSAATEAKEQT